MICVIISFDIRNDQRIGMARGLSDAHRFWRDPALSFLEARAVEDGREVCYGMHSHQTFSIGLVTGGRSEYRIGRVRHEVTAGAVVLMNPEETHACNPLEDLPWSYRMLYVDVPWLTGVQQGNGFTPYATVLSTDPALYRQLKGLFDVLFDTESDVMSKEYAATAFFADLHHRLGQTCDPVGDTHSGLKRAAEFITSHCTRPLRLADICAASGLSPSYLVRAFKARYGLTPHAYQINRRIQYGQKELRRGRPIVDVALEAGFADQAHFQRAFKRHVAATPRQYAVAQPA
ncbi:MAG TPA: AraC family transcriptional regulator [Azospirillum sp.]|nr:AraC family transcriptional regulator [Azospirillum sp.]